MSVKQQDSASILNLPVVSLVGATGPVGDVGPTGPQGIPTVVGATGQNGNTGPMAIGPTGPDAGTGPTGPRGATGPSDDTTVLGPEGWWGDWGDDGPTGPTGPPGRTGSAGFAGGPQGGTGGIGPIGAGSYGGVQVPFFADGETYLTTPFNRKVQMNGVSYNQLSNGVIGLVPVFVPYARTFTELVADSYQGYYEGSGVFFRMAIYDCDENMHPTVPLVQSPNIQVGGAGRLGFSFSRALAAKPYYFAMLTNQYGLYFRCLASDQVTPVLGWRKYADNHSWYFEATGMKYSSNSPFYNYDAGFIDLTNKVAPDLDLTSGAVVLLGMR